MMSVFSSRPSSSSLDKNFANLDIDRLNQGVIGSASADFVF